jgi:phosphoribosylglycinamide formyltransferase-1
MITETENLYNAEPPPDSKIVVLISGGGSNLQAIIKACEDPELPATIAAVISNKADAYGLVRAEKAGIPTEVLDHNKFDSREVYDAELLHIINRYQPDLVVLAGFMRILTPDFVRYFSGKMLNIHPSLLPKYPGLKTHERALKAGDKEHGATVHFVTEELDGGPNIIQAVVPILDDDRPVDLAKRVLHEEHIIYPIAVRWFILGRIKMISTHNEQDETENVVVLDDTPLPPSGLQWSSQN